LKLVVDEDGKSNERADYGDGDKNRNQTSHHAASTLINFPRSWL
jgi:hypothetical protein